MDAIDGLVSLPAGGVYLSGGGKGPLAKELTIN